MSDAVGIIVLILFIILFAVWMVSMYRASVHDAKRLKKMNLPWEEKEDRHDK